MQQAKCRRVRWRGGQDAWGRQAFSYIAGIAEGFASSSRSVPAAVRLDDLTVDPAAPGAGQERDHARDVVGLTKTAERDVIRQALDQLFRPAAQEQPRCDRAGRDRVDSDAAEVFMCSAPSLNRRVRIRFTPPERTAFAIHPACACPHAC
jgi:hypothetical protein